MASFLKEYMHARALASSPSYAAKYNGQAEQQQREKFITGLMGQEGAPALAERTDPNTGQVYPATEAVQGSGVLGGQMDPKEFGMRMLAAPGKQSRGVGAAVMKQQMTPDAGGVSFEDYRNMGSRERGMYNKFEGLDETVPSDVLNDRYYKSLSDEDKKSYLLRKRSGQWLDQQNQFQNPVTGEIIEKNTVENEVNKKAGGDVGKRLVNFEGDIAVADDMLASIERTQGTLASLSGKTNYSTTGFMSWLNMVPTSDQKTWENIKTTVQSQLGLDKLLEMKASSATGASGFGALSERELDLLVSNMGKLDGTSDPREIRRIIKNISNTLDGKTERMKRRRKRKIDFYRRNRNYLPAGTQLTDAEIDGLSGAAPAAAADGGGPPPGFTEQVR